MRMCLLNGGKLGIEGGGSGGAADTGAIEVLEGDDGSLNTSSLFGVGVAGGEADLDRRATRKWLVQLRTI